MRVLRDGSEGVPDLVAGVLALAPADRQKVLADLGRKICLHCMTEYPDGGLVCNCWKDDQLGAR